MADQAKTFVVEGARLIFKNFAGKESQYNREGDRNFGLVLPQDLADKLAADGWVVKVLPAREEGDDDTLWMPVEIKFKHRPPRIVTLADGGKVRTHLNESSVEIVDSLDIENVDLVVRAYEWGPINDKSGIKAYLQSMFITILEDELERKYRINQPVEGSND